jgi:polygalacturonase
MMHLSFRSWFMVAFSFLGWLTPGLAASSAVEASPPAALRLFAAPQTLRSDEVTLLWDKPEGARAGRILYELVRDGAVIARTAKTHFTAKNLLPGHRYDFTVRARTAPDGAALSASNPLSLETPAKESVMSVVDHGAIGDGKTLNTKAIQAAIDQCPPHGVVLIPAGVFVSGALFLKSDMTLEIAEGGVLKGSIDPADYAPFILNRFEGWEMKTYASLLNAGTLDHAGPAHVRNLSIRGQGTISGGGRTLSDAIRRALPGTPGLRARGRLILLMNAENVEVAGLTLEETPCWTLHYVYSENVSLHGLTIRSDVLNGDGIDPDSSRNSYIFNCTFDTGDDCIAIKSGKNPEGNRIDRPTENVRIFDCAFIRGHGISIGSEMSGGVRGVLVEDCIAGNLLHGFQIKATKDRGNVVEDVTVRDCDLQKISILTALPYNNDGSPAPEQPYFRNFRFSHLDLSKAAPASAVILVNGFPAEGHRTKNVVFENIKLPSAAIVEVDQAEDVTFANVLNAEGEKPVFKISRSDRISY